MKKLLAANRSEIAVCISLRAVAQTSFDVSQALRETDLRESHFEKMVTGGHTFAGSGHPMQFHAALELFPIQQINDLGECQTSGVHCLLKMKPCITCQPVQMRDTCFELLAS